MTFHIRDSIGLRFMMALTIILLLGFLSSFGNALLRNQRIADTLAEIAADNQRLAVENQQLLSDMRYLSSRGYREKWAKQHLAQAENGEQLLYVHIAAEDSTEVLQNLTARELQQYALLRSSPMRQWQAFFFGDTSLWDTPAQERATTE